MARILNEDYVGGSVINEDRTKLPPTVLCRVRYPICNIGTLNRNNRRYDKEVFERVLSNEDVQDKLKRRVLFGEIEHPVTETVTRLDRPITHTTHQIVISEADKKVYADLDLLDTPAGNLVYTLLNAKCDVGVSTRAEGELEEAIDEATGNKYFRVLPEAYVFRAIDFTADESTLGALPIKIEHNIVRQIKSGVGEGKVDKTLAKVILENFRSKAAVELCESLKSEESMKKDAKNEGKAPEAGANDTDVVTALTEKEEEENKELAEVPVAPDAPIAEPAPIIDEPVPAIVEPAPAPATAADAVASVLDVADKAKQAIDQAAEVIVKTAELAATVETPAPVEVPAPIAEPMPAPVEEIPVEEIPEEELGEKKLQKKLDALRDEYIKECQITESLKKEKKALEEKITANSSEYSKKITEALKKIVRLEKANEALKQVNESLTKEKEQIKESVSSDFVKAYVTNKVRGSGYEIPSNVLTLLESCKSLDEVDSQFGKATQILTEVSLHFNEISEIEIPLNENKESNKENERIQENVHSALKSIF